MWILILKLFLISLIPLCGSILLKLLDKYVIKDKWNRILKWIIYGVIFGGFSIVGSILGVDVGEGAIINVRDVAPIVGGLIFDWPVGIIAGVIGGTFRLVSVYWGIAGEFTMYACGISTMMAGVFTALYKKFIVANKPAKWSGALFLGLLVEDFHMLLVFLTRINFPERAYNVASACALPMILVTTISSVVCLLAINVIDKIPVISRSRPPRLSAFLRGMLACTLIGMFVIVSVTSYVLLSNDTNERVQKTLDVACKDVEDSVTVDINVKLLESIQNAGATANQSFDIGDEPLDIIDNLLASTKFTEINLVNKNNIIVYSSNPNCINYDMMSGTQSAEFTFLAATNSYYIQDFQPMSMDSDTYMRYCGISLRNNSYNIAYIQCGLNEEAYTSLINSTISVSTNYTHVMQKGFVAVTDFQGNVISILNDYNFIDRLDVNEYDLNKVYTTVIEKPDGTKTKFSFLMKYTDGYHILAYVDYDEAHLDLNITFYSLSVSQVTLYLILYFVVMLILKTFVTDKISRISKALNKITAGDLNVHVSERQSFEMNQLSNDINQTVDTLNEHAREEAEKIEKELLFAKQIQLSALPCSFPAYPNIEQFDLYAMMDTAKEVGGDFYDFYLVDNDHIAIQIADVSGKGVPAAMFMMKAKTVIKSLVGSGMPIDEAYIEANNKLCEGNEAQMFVTAWLGVIDIRTGHVEYVNAGHNPPLVKHRGGQFEYLQGKRGFVLAGMEDFKYVKQEFNIEAGDQIFLYTDGVTEATNKELVLYGEERLLRKLNGNSDIDPTNLCKFIKTTIDEFVDGAEQSDDITMLAFQYNGDMNAKTIEVDALTPNIDQVTGFVEKFLEEKEAPMEFVMKINVVIDEIFSNIARYGFPEGEPSKVRITASINSDNQFVLVFIDNGIPYNPLAKEDPDITLSAEDRPIGGLGIFIVKKIMDEMLYERSNNRNILSLKKNLTSK